MYMLLDKKGEGIRQRVKALFCQPELKSDETNVDRLVVSLLSNCSNPEPRSELNNFSDIN
jgi:hypothetical protein